MRLLAMENLTAVRRLATQRIAGIPSWALVTQLFIGLGWLRAVAEKLIDPAWWTGAVIRDFAGAHDGTTLGWYEPFVNEVVLPAAPLFALVVVVGQLVAGASLVTGRRLDVGLSVGMFLNLNFIAVGAVTPSAFYLLTQGALALWMAEEASTLSATKHLTVATAVAAGLVGLNLPFISMLHPAHVIEDPAIMFTLGGALTVFACEVAARARTLGHGGSQAAAAPHLSQK